MKKIILFMAIFMATTAIAVNTASAKSKSAETATTHLTKISASIDPGSGGINNVTADMPPAIQPKNPTI